MHIGISGISHQPFSWQLADDLLHFIDAHVREGDTTLEIGAGVSTILFALKGATHLCIAPAEDELDRIRAFCRDHGIPLDNLTFEVDRSDRCLPRLDWKLEADYGPRSVVFRKLRKGGLGRNEWDQPYVVEQTLNFMFAKYGDEVEDIRPYVPREAFEERKRRARIRRMAAGFLPGPVKRSIKRVLGL